MASYIEIWQAALRKEIHQLKNYGNTKIRLFNGQLVQKTETFLFHFEASSPTTNIPIGATVTLHWGKKMVKGRMRSSEGRSVILEVDESLGDQVSEVLLQYDPWELLDQLHERLEEMKDNKKKLARIKRLMKPSFETKHPMEKARSGVHELVLRSKYNPVTFVWGPPGTGKTYTLARVAANHGTKQKKVLILSQSNQAVDVLILELYEFLKKKEQFQVGAIVRYGSNVSDQLAELPITVSYLLQDHEPTLAAQKNELVEERKGVKGDLVSSFSKRDSERLLEIEGKLAQILEKLRGKEVDLVDRAHIVATTLAKAATDPAIYEKEYDYVLVDEVSMAYVPQLAFAVSLAKKAILCGDFKQLPPIAHAKHKLVEEWLKVDIFHKVQVTERYQGALHPQLFLLDKQRRMHPDVSAFTNQYIYDSLVSDHPSVRESRKEIALNPPFSSYASILVDASRFGEYCLRTTSGSRVNIWQLLMSFQLIHEAIIGGSQSIGYTTPYRVQAEWMEILLKEFYPNQWTRGDILSATVHKFQGSEREVMVFDSVDSYPQPYPSMLLTGSGSERLINVAMTRTKGKFLHVADRNYLEKKLYPSKMLRKLIDHQVRTGQIVPKSHIGKWIVNQHPNVKWIHAKKLDLLQNDLVQAKVWRVYLPKDAKLNQETKRIFSSNQQKCQRMEGDWNFPFIMIDDEVLWLGMPFEAVKQAEPPYVGVRVVSRGLCQALLTTMLQQ